jgi:serine/threonine protein kinase
VNSQPRYQPGDKIGGRYEVHRALRGSMGEVYLCLDLEEMYPYALKTFHGQYLASPKLRAAFENEVATWVALEKHPNIVRCFYMDMLDNQPFMFLEWIVGEEGKGSDLRGWLRHRPLDLKLALDFTIDICRGLIYAGEKQPGIVHRDLKPENILVAQGRLAKITDFGLAMIVLEADLEITDVEGGIGERQSLMGQGGIVGTPPYMAPEQWQDGALDARTDIYAVGCILYEMLTRSWPFRATTLNSLRLQHLEAHIPTLPENQTWSSSIDALLARCLAKRPEERFETLSDLLEELNLIYQEQFDGLPKTISSGGEFTAVDYNGRGATYNMLNRYDQALTDFDRAIEIDPNYAPIYLNRAGTFHDLRQYDKALADCDRAIKLDPTFASAYSNRSQLNHDLGRYEEALEDCKRAIQLDPTFAGAYNNRGITYSELRQYDEALADYTQAIQLDPTDVTAYYNRGNTCHSLGRYDDALADYAQAIHLGPTFAQPYCNRG